MGNQLENLCEERGIVVEFVTNKFIDNERGAKYNKPVIKVHKVFKECPMKVATAVVEIFTGEGYTSECIEIIERYLKEKFGPIGIKIQPPEVIRARPVNNNMGTGYKKHEEDHGSNEEMYKGYEGIYNTRAEKYHGKNENYYSVDEKYIEAEIAVIELRNLGGQQKKLRDNESLTLKDNDILELDIVIDPPLHK